MKGSTVITVAAVGIGGWWLMNNWATLFGPSVAADAIPTPLPSTPATPLGAQSPLVVGPITVAIPPPAAAVPPPSLMAPAALIAALKATANGDPILVNGMMDQDHWNYYRNEIVPPALTGAQLASAFPGPDVAITADAFVAQLQSVGLAGYRTRPRTIRGARRGNYIRKVAA